MDGSGILTQEEFETKKNQILQTNDSFFEAPSSPNATRPSEKAKEHQPFYKTWWFILLIFIIALG